MNMGLPKILHIGRAHLAGKLSALARRYFYSLAKYSMGKQKVHSYHTVGVHFLLPHTVQGPTTLPQVVTTKLSVIKVSTFYFFTVFSKLIDL